jgi:phosphate transport system permease protein
MVGCMFQGKERITIVYAWLCALSSLLVIASLLGFLLVQGSSALSPNLFFGEAPVWPALTGKVPVWEGIWPACVGTLTLVFLAVSIALPLGLGCGLYLALMATGRTKDLCTILINQLASIPSIIMGLFGFALILFLRKTFFSQANTCLLLAASCMAVLILPYIVRSTQNAVQAIPLSHRLIGPSLGLTLGQNIVHIILPQAGKGILGGVILAVGRAAEDTAVILLTGVVANSGLPQGLLGNFEALPFTIYFLAAEFRSSQDLLIGFGTCLVLLLLTSSLFVLAHLIQRGLHRQWS